ncbi:MAG: L,D-transpeptidase family protein [Alphaproteobacteria bacterium]|nr:L,D-transpeptidase family protein [Alphaproteobacteria bacterium]
MASLPIKKTLSTSALILLLCIIGFYFFHNSQNPIQTLPPIDAIVIDKEKRTMTIFSNEKPIKAYTIALGFSPKGHKEKEGDGKTPEGSYTICAKNTKSQFHLSLKISYPNQEDRDNAKAKGVTPGSDIMIHGLGKVFSWMGSFHTKRDWTLGCVAVTNKEIEEIFASTKVGTPVDIKP